MGGGVASGRTDVLEPFLLALCGPLVDSATIPEVVLIARTECSPAVRALIKEPWAKRAPVRYFVGSPMVEEDLARVQARAPSTPVFTRVASNRAP